MRKLKMENGSEIILNDDLKRIVSFSPAVTETLFDLGLGDNIIADSAFCARPEGAKNKRKLASYSTTRIDVLEELKPDIILTIGGYQEILYNKLNDKFKTYMFELPSSMFGILDMINRIGIVVNRKKEARDLVSSLSKNIKINDGKIKTYFEMDLGGPVTFGSMSYITDALYFLGFETIYMKYDAEWLYPDFEFVKTMDPDVIIYEHKMYRDFNEKDMEKIINDRDWHNISAVRNGNVFITPGKLDFFAHHGPSFFREVIPWADNVYKSIKRL
ncbi:ABC transporter substrate-binding protein [Picrophilus oshimae]|nr:ABC transporter substrate-binding protein [Picrophilus oshimae]